MHSSCAVDTPPLLSAPLVLAQGRTSPSPVEVSMTPLPLRSTQRKLSANPTLTTEPLGVTSARLVVHTSPNRSTVVRDGSRPRPSGPVRYSPSTRPDCTSILTMVPRAEHATQMNGNG